MLIAFGYFLERLRIGQPQLWESLKRCGFGALLLIVVTYSDIMWAGPGYRIISFPNVFFPFIPWIAIGLAIYSLFRCQDLSRTVVVLLSIFLVGVELYAAVPHYVSFFPTAFPEPFNQIIGAGGFLFLRGLIASLGAVARIKVLFNTALFFMALRIVVIYIQVFGSLTATGIGLVFTGLLILGLGMGWNQLRKSVQRT